MKKDFDEWVAWGKQKKRFISFYKQRALDLTDFVRIHPGGKKSLENYIFKDVSSLIFTVYPHKKETTINKLFSYTIGTNTSYGQQKKNDKQNDKNLKTRSKSKKKVVFRDNIAQNVLNKRQSYEYHGYTEDKIVKEHAKIRQSIKQRNNERFASNDKHEVSIKLISQGEIQSFMNKVHQKQTQRQKKMMLDQLDQNIESQQFEQLTIVSKMPQMKVKNIRD